MARHRAVARSSLFATMSTLPKEIEAKYEVLAMMGEGGMGAVYKVRHRHLDVIQVIKVMQAGLRSNKDLKARFLREAKTAKHFRHPSIAEVTDFDVTRDGIAYIVMEFIEGVDLRNVLSRAGTALECEFVSEISRQVLEALSYLHGEGFVHRDISPDNIMLSRTASGKPLIKLIDLGIVKAIEGSHSLTMDGKFIGKVQYASPEQFGGIDGRAKVDARSDLYSLGVVMYELLTDTEPILGTDYRAIIAGHLHRPPRPFSETDPAARVPTAVRLIVMKALEKEPSRRFQSAREFANALAQVDEVRDTAAERRMETSALEAEWIGAQESRSFRVLEDFLARNAATERAVAAREALEALEEEEEKAWRMAEAADAVTGWTAYIAAFPDSPRTGRAERRRSARQLAADEAAAWTLASSSGTVDGWRQYLSLYSNSHRAAEAQRALSDLQRAADEDRAARLALLQTAAAEQQAWRTAENADSSASWAEYLALHSESERAAIARDRLKSAEEREREQVDWDLAVAVATSSAWDAYLSAHPGSERSTTARAFRAAVVEREREEAAWRVSSAENSSASWRAYLEQHGNSARAAEARLHLDRTVTLEREEEIRRQRERQRATEQAAWNEALAEDSVAAWQKYMEGFAASPRAAEGARRLKIAEKHAAANAAWPAVLAENSVGRFEEFLLQYGDTRIAHDARSRLVAVKARELKLEHEREAARLKEEMERSWAAAQGEDSVPAYEDFLRRYPKAALSEAARKSLAVAQTRQLQSRPKDDAERKAALRQETWSRATERDSVDSWKSYLRQFPSGPNSERAGQFLRSAEEREREAVVFRQALLDDSVKSWRSYLSEFPSGPNRQSAEESLRHAEEKENEAAAWRQASRHDSVTSLEEFLRDYPASANGAPAREKLRAAQARDAATLAWERASAADSLEGWRAFLESHPSSTTAAAASKRLAHMKAAEAAAAAKHRGTDAPPLEPQPPLSVSEQKAAETIHLPVAIPRTIVESDLPKATSEPRPVEKPAPIVRPEEPVAWHSLSRVFTFVPPGREKRAVAGAAVVAVVLLSAGLGIALHGSREDNSPRPNKTTPPAAMQAGSVATPTINGPTGELQINALPWAVVESVVDERNYDHIPHGSPIYTPLVLNLPEGQYRVTLFNPNSAKRMTLTSSVVAGRSSVCQQQLDEIDPAAYLRGVGLR
jgi:tRNA A-37 threonylcarbamoyl transferase component Bud32